MFSVDFYFYIFNLSFRNCYVLFLYIYISIELSFIFILVLVLVIQLTNWNVIKVFKDKFLI